MPSEKARDKKKWEKPELNVKKEICSNAEVLPPTSSRWDAPMRSERCLEKYYYPCLLGNSLLKAIKQL